MPNIEILIDSVSQHLTNTQNGQQAYFSTIDLKYIYSQLQLHKVTAEHYNFNIISGKSTDTYRFKTGFFGLTDKSAESKKAMDYTLAGLQNTHCFLNDIIIVRMGSESELLSYVSKCIKKLDEDNMRINFQKRHFFKTEIEWLGYNFTQTGISLIEKNCSYLSYTANINIETFEIFSWISTIH